MLRNARYAAVLLILIFLAPAWAMAQDQWAGRWWDRPRIAERLDITAGEKASLDDLYNQARRNLLDLKNEVEKQRLELEIALEAQPLNKDAAMERFLGVEEARSRLATERFRFLLEIRSLLGRDRFQDLKRFFEAQRRGRGPAPGGSPAPGPGRPAQ
ncbi:MAG: hypothetical protein ABIJ95_02905, partial [Pseudomonadota bacterium]